MKSHIKNILEELMSYSSAILFNKIRENYSHNCPFDINALALELSLLSLPILIFFISLYSINNT